MVQPDNIPGELKSLDHWCVWRHELDDGVRMSKPPYQSALPSERAYNTLPDTWSPFWMALNTYRARHGFDGIALALDGTEGIVGVDLDHVSEWSDDAWRIVRTLNSYTEKSPSGDGYRIFVYATMPEGRRKRDHVEMYGQARIFTVTGHSLGVQRHLQHRQAEIDEIHHEFLGTDYARSR